MLQEDMVQTLTHRTHVFGYLFDMRIGNRIAQERTRLGLSQADLADALGVSRGLVGQWESHKKDPGRENLMKAAELFGVPAEYLIKGLAEGQEDIPRAMTITDDNEIQLVSSFKLLSERQKKRLAEFLRESIGVRRKIEKKRSPSDREPVDG
jgi:transcriptional regulator with XRE-family HTH domain